MRRTRLAPLALLPVVALLALGTSPVAPTSAPAPAAAVPAVTAAALDALLAPGAEPGDASLARVGGTVPAGQAARMSAQAASVAARTAAVEPALADARWQLEGPTNVGGRLLDVVVDPLRADSVYVAAASGGVWHSTDKGMRFRSVWPDDLGQAIGALAVSKTGVLWAGTGEAGPGGGSTTYGGTGVYRSADGGKTWKNMGLRLTERIGRVVVDPTDEDVVWVAANGPLYSEGGERGLYKTVDGGASWDLVLEGANDTTGAVDVQLDPTEPDTVYATMWDRIRYPDRRVYTGVGSGAFKSTDGGESWTRIGGPALASNPKLGRLGIAVAATDADRVYILASTDLGATAGVLRSDDGGATFGPRIDVELITGGFVFAWWFGRIYVDPKDADHVFATGVNMSESTDGALTFRSSPDLHADQHGMAWDPRVDGRVYVGNDGGAYRSDDNGASFIHGEYMPWNQPFSVDVSTQDPRKKIVGLQDNGSNRNYTADEEPSESGYNSILGGDGTETTIDPRDDNYVYACSQYGGCSVSDDGGETTSDFSNEIVGARKVWLTPIEFAPDRQAVYTASEIVHESLDNGQTWTPISPPLTVGTGQELNPLFRNYGAVTTLAVGDEESGTIYAGTDDGKVAYTHDSGTTWTQATGLPTDWVTSVNVDPADADIAYATFSAFRSGGDKAMVWRTTDGGETWTDISGDLPQAPVNDLAAVGGDLVVASDAGVFLTRTVATGLGARWLTVGGNLPAAPNMDLRWHAPTETLYVANFGRGAYSVKLAGLGGGLARGPVSRPGAAPAAPARDVASGGLAATGLPVAVALGGSLALLTGVLLRRRRDEAGPGA